MDTGASRSRPMTKLPADTSKHRPWSGPLVTSSRTRGSGTVNAPPTSVGALPSASRRSVGPLPSGVIVGHEPGSQPTAPVGRDPASSSFTARILPETSGRCCVAPRKGAWQTAQNDDPRLTVGAEHEGQVERTTHLVGPG